MTTLQATILILLIIGVAMGTLGTLLRITYVINQVDTLGKHLRTMEERVTALDKELRG